MQQPEQRPITYFVVQPATFQAICARLGKLPYEEVAGLIQDFVGTSRAMFDPLPEIPAPGAGIPNAPPPAMEAKPPGNGEDKTPAAPAGATDDRPGWSRSMDKHPDPNTVQEYDAAQNCWWIKDDAPTKEELAALGKALDEKELPADVTKPGTVDKDKSGGAE